jgi:hypothetical protein
MEGVKWFRDIPSPAFAKKKCKRKRKKDHG